MRGEYSLSSDFVGSSLGRLAGSCYLRTPYDAYTFTTMVKKNISEPLRPCPEVSGCEGDRPVHIRLVTGNKREYFPLLLLADEQER